MEKRRSVDGTTLWCRPEPRFERLPDYPFIPHCIAVRDEQLGLLRMPCLEFAEGYAGGTIPLERKEPSWSCLGRSRVMDLLAVNHRVIGPGQICFGRSDKPGSFDENTDARHLARLMPHNDRLDVKDITQRCGECGDVVGLCIAAAKPARFARVIVAHSGPPECPDKTPFRVTAWRRRMPCPDASFRLPAAEDYRQRRTLPQIGCKARSRVADSGCHNAHLATERNGEDGRRRSFERK